MNLRKFLMYQLSAAQAKVAALETLVKEFDSEQSEETTEAPKTEAKPKASRKAKAKEEPPVETEEATDTEEDAPSEDDDLFGDDDDADAMAEPTRDDVRKTMKAFATKHGKEKALKLLSRFKATSTADVKDKDFAKVIELANKYL